MRSRPSTLLPCFCFRFRFDMMSPPLEWRLKHAAFCDGPSAWRHDKAVCPQNIWAVWTGLAHWTIRACLIKSVGSKPDRFLGRWRRRTHWLERSAA
jgi:hypothetical protein